MQLNDSVTAVMLNSQLKCKCYEQQDIYEKAEIRTPYDPKNKKKLKLIFFENQSKFGEAVFDLDFYIENKFQQLSDKLSIQSEQNEEAQLTFMFEWQFIEKPADNNPKIINPYLSGNSPQNTQRNVGQSPKRLAQSKKIGDENEKRTTHVTYSQWKDHKEYLKNQLERKLKEPKHPQKVVIVDDCNYNWSDTLRKPDAQVRVVSPPKRFGTPTKTNKKFQSPTNTLNSQRQQDYELRMINEKLSKVDKQLQQMNNDNTNNDANYNEFELQLQRFQFSLYAFGFNFYLDNQEFNRGDSFGEEDDIVRGQRLAQRRERNSPREKYQNLQKYLQKRTEPIQNDHLDQSQPYIKVTCQRNTNVNNQYFINEFGLIGSLKNTNSKDILIGRSHRNQNQDLIPNDIILPEDRVISRIHCKIVCKDYFRKDQILDQGYQFALMHINLPKMIKHKISQFLEEPRNVYIQDLGSICGTYLRVFRSEPYLLSIDTKFSIGSETNFSIVLNETYKQNLKEVDQEFYRTLKRLSCLKSSQRHEIYFQDKQKQQEFQQLEEETTTTNPREYYQKLKEYNVPILGIKFSGQGVDQNKQHNILIGKQNLDTDDFYIGRGAENAIKINQNTISRKQCRIKYSVKHQSWVISDGALDRDSANGTWVSLSTVEQSDMKKESNQIILKHNSEIKIGDFNLKVELVKGQRRKFGQQIKELLSV